jgi:hypothetical protein
MGGLLLPLYRKRYFHKENQHSSNFNQSKVEMFFNYFDVLLALSKASLVQYGGRKYHEIDLKKVNIHFAIEQLRIDEFKNSNDQYVRVHNLNSKSILAA